MGLPPLGDYRLDRESFEMTAGSSILKIKIQSTAGKSTEVQPTEVQPTEPFCESALGV
ncbi:MAG: hypothetical protein ACI9MC_000029, partial [Kiritimatiellia bacterium]